MNTELQNGFIWNHGVHMDDQEETDKSHFESIGHKHCFENTDSSIKIDIDNIENHSRNAHSHSENIDNVHPVIDIGLGNINQQVEVKGESFDKSLFEQAHDICFGNNSSNFQEKGNLHKNMDSVLENLQQEMAVKKQRLENLHPDFENKDNIHVSPHKFETTNSNFLVINSVEDGILVEAINIKHEIDNQQDKGHIVLEDKIYTKYVKNNLNSNNTDDLTTGESKVSITTGLEGGSSTIENVHVKIENNFHTYESINFKSEIGDVNMENFDSGFEAMDCKNEEMDSQIDLLDSGVDKNKLELEVDSHHNVLIKRLQDKPGLKVCSMIQNVFCQPERISFAKSYQEEVHMSCNESSSLEQHQFTQSNEQPHQCNMCEKRFKKVEQLRNHMLSHQADWRYQCIVCKQKFMRLNHLRKHMTSHTTEGSCHCNVCSKEFNTVDILRTHMMIHSTERSHQCNVCAKRFSRSDVLKSHMISHSTERPHQCNVCDKGFKRLNALRAHMIHHSTDELHQCNVCDKGFKRLNSLRAHMISHSTERPHQCNVCDKGFKRSNGLRVHMTSQH